MAVYQEKDKGTWRVVFWYTDFTGERKQTQKRGFKTKKEALEFIPELKKGNTNPDIDITFQKLYERWVLDHESKVGESTMKGYAASFKHFKPIWGHKFRTVTTDDMQECLNDGDKGRRTKELMKALASSLFKYAASRQIVSHNYAQYLYVGNEKKGTHPAFTAKQIEQIRKAAAAGDVRAIYTYCLIYLGFRPNEMLSLQRDAYHKEEDVEYLVGGGKTEAGTDRIVPISPKIKSYIYELILKSNPYIFPREDGKLMDDKWFRDRYFYPLLADLLIQPMPDKEHPAVLVPYSCRHTFTNFLKNVEGARKDKASLVGHTDYSFTEKAYQSAELYNLVAIVNKI